MWLLITSALAGALFPCGAQDILAKTASNGALAHYERACLDGIVEQEGAFMHEASRMLLDDASARGNRVHWSRVAARHLDRVDGTDASLNVAYARFLFASHRTEELIAFSDRALRHAPDWADPVQSLALHRLRTSAALARWTETTVGMERVHAFARSWVEAARDLGVEEPTADQLCRFSGDVEDCAETISVAAADTGMP